MNRLSTIHTINLFFVLWSLSQISCDKKSDTANEEPSISKKALTSRLSAAETTATVCVWDNVPLRAIPTRSGKWLSSISLGETVQWLGKTSIDSTDKNREYLNIKLSDGTTGWASSYGLIRDAKVGAIKAETPIYKRPDLLTITDKKFEMMDMLATTAEKGEWVKVVGEKRKKSGWIKSENITTHSEDVAVAILASKKLQQTNEMTESEQIEQIIAETPYPESFFIKKLREKISDSETEDVKDTQPIPGDTVQTDINE